MCDKHPSIEVCYDTAPYTTPLSLVCYNACLLCIRANLHTVESIVDPEKKTDAQAFAIECVAWGNHEKNNIVDQEKCILFFIDLGWKDKFGYVSDHLSNRLSFFCAIKLIQSGSIVSDNAILTFTKKGSPKQIRLITSYTGNRYGLLWLLGHRIGGRDIADKLVMYL